MIYITGDKHGSFRDLRLSGQGLSTGDTLIVLGDLGANYYLNERDDEFKRDILKLPYDLFVIRGNHEQRPSILAKEKPFDWHLENAFGNYVYVENKYPNLKYALDDVAIYQIDSKKILSIPGAYSVDKHHRLLQGWSWFPFEQLQKEEMTEAESLLSDTNEFDIILSHTCPVSKEPKDLFLKEVSQNSVDRTMENWLEKISHKIKYDKWIWGHYHEDRVYPGGKHIMVFNGVFNLEKMSLN